MVLVATQIGDGVVRFQPPSESRMLLLFYRSSNPELVTLSMM